MKYVCYKNADNIEKSKSKYGTAPTPHQLGIATIGPTPGTCSSLLSQTGRGYYHDWPNLKPRTHSTVPLFVTPISASHWHYFEIYLEADFLSPWPLSPSHPSPGHYKCLAWVPIASSNVPCSHFLSCQFVSCTVAKCFKNIKSNYFHTQNTSVASHHKIKNKNKNYNKIKISYNDIQIQ